MFINDFKYLRMKGAVKWPRIKIDYFSLYFKKNHEASKRIVGIWLFQAAMFIRSLLTEAFSCCPEYLMICAIINDLHYVVALVWNMPVINRGISYFIKLLQRFPVFLTL